MKMRINKPVLRIVRGKTQFPVRALDVEQYLIGAGSTCHLQLSAGEIPMMFGMITPEADGHLIEAMHPEPTLLVNGGATRKAVLRPGDQFQIGTYRFEYLMAEVEHELRATDSISPRSERTKLDQSVVPNQLESKKLQELTAAQLVDKIEQELKLLDELDHYDDLEHGYTLEFPEGDQSGPNRLSA
ncbi:FHA domain-containing protein [Rubinisphaera margarita]|uniref:FHA domain-containing protein n=1 Tax=Rubinisphaera margarita TaxID=2909586 RepID=UPI001EE9091E|nr:FHA domain-containing protein [Rubinisphaera margarita]MCG6157841.1 FHA domain-containing protein [Rubinisphaera margarita]